MDAFDATDGGERLSRRSLLGRTAALSGGAITGSALLPGGMGPLAQAISAGPTAVEARRLRLDDLALTPPAFGSPVSAGFTWGFVDGDPKRRDHRHGNGRNGHHGRPYARWSPPNTYLRVYVNVGGNVQTLPNRIHQNTKGPLGAPVDLFPGQTYAGPAPWVQVNGPAPEGPSSDPYHWLQEATGPDGRYLLYRYSSKRARAIEKGPGGAPIMDVTYDFFPYGMYLHGPTGAFFPYFSQMGHVRGTFNGKRVSYLGGTDRLFAATTNFNVPEELFVGLFFAGQHRDGRREWGFVGWIDGLEGERGTGWYVRERGRGRYEIVTSDRVKLLDADWGIQEGTGIPVFTSASWRFKGKVIDYKAKWAFLAGQGTRSNTTGVWRERGSTASDFVHNLTFSESHATPEQVGLA